MCCYLHYERHLNRVSNVHFSDPKIKCVPLRTAVSECTRDLNVLPNGEHSFLFVGISISPMAISNRSVPFGSESEREKSATQSFAPNQGHVPKTPHKPVSSASGTVNDPRISTQCRLNVLRYQTATYPRINSNSKNYSVPPPASSTPKTTQRYRNSSTRHRASDGGRGERRTGRTNIGQPNGTNPETGLYSIRHGELLCMEMFARTILHVPIVKLSGTFAVPRTYCIPHTYVYCMLLILFRGDAKLET